MQNDGLNKHLLAEKQQREFDRLAVAKRVQDRRRMRQLGIRLGYEPMPQKPRTHKSLPGQMELF